MISLNHFENWEFGCKCGQCGLGISHMDPVFLKQLDGAREIAGVPFVLSSPIRCKEHNDNEGGSDTSSHLTGNAGDIEIDGSRNRFRIIEALLSAGFTRIGVSESFIHVDNDPNKSAEVFWLY